MQQIITKHRLEILIQLYNCLLLKCRSLTKFFGKDVINYNCRALVASVPFFTNAEPSFVSEVVTKLKYEVYQPGRFLSSSSNMRSTSQVGFQFKLKYEAYQPGRFSVQAQI